MSEDSSSNSMEGSARLFNRQRCLHEVLGGGIVADVILWRRMNASIGILVGAAAAWILFEKSGYTLLSLLANVLLLLVTILFVWATAAALIGRPPPPLPELELTEETANETASSIRAKTNFLIKVANDIALGKDPKLFFKVAFYLWLISTIGSWFDFLTLGYTSLVILLTVPAIYEKYEDHVDKYAIIALKELRKLYLKLNEYVTTITSQIHQKYKYYSKGKKIV
uniref:Reticulon-like protein n=1 Tax=Araucaria cunninghamii TaxID=56994 RepID=A0A0D6R364_ARACU